MSPIVLITNIRTIVVGDLRVHTGALIVEPAEYHSLKKAQLRGFLYDSSSPTITVDLTTTEWKQTQLGLVDGIAGGLELKFGEFSLEVWRGSSDRRPIYVERVDGETHSELYARLWATLDQRIADYWDRPNTPRATWSPNHGRRSRGSV